MHVFDAGSVFPLLEGTLPLVRAQLARLGVYPACLLFQSLPPCSTQPARVPVKRGETRVSPIDGASGRIAPSRAATDTTAFIRHRARRCVSQLASPRARLSRNHRQTRFSLSRLSSAAAFIPRSVLIALRIPPLLHEILGADYQSSIAVRRWVCVALWIPASLRTHPGGGLSRCIP